MASEKKPKRKYGQNWAKLSNSQADISAVYQKLVGNLPSLQQNEEPDDHEEIEQVLEKQQEIKKDPTKDSLINKNTTEDILTLGTMTPGSKIPQGQNVPGDKISLVSPINDHQSYNVENIDSATIKPNTQENNKNKYFIAESTSKNRDKAIIDPRDKMTLESISPWSDIESNYLKLPNSVVDNLMKLLDSSEFTVYLRLYRLSHGFKQTYCMVGYSSLSEACNLSSRQIRRIIPSLVSRNLIRIVEVFNEAQKQGTLYEIYTPDKMSVGTIFPQGQNITEDKMSTNKSDDHDDLKKTDHHQSEHEKAVMMIYQKITGNSWTKADIGSYQKIKNIPLESIEMAIKLAAQRAATHPNSLAYFVKEIVNTANPPKQNRSLRKKIMEKIVDRVRNSFVGSSYTMSDFTHKVKDLCIKEDINFDNDIFDELLAKKK